MASKKNFRIVSYTASASRRSPPMRIHVFILKSDEVLETGMTFNVEPSIYVAGYGGARIANMVAVTENGMELLTDFQDDLT